MYMSPAGRITQLCFINHHKFTQVIKLLIGAYILRNGVSLALGFLDGSVVKNLPANAGDSGSVPGLGGSPGEGIGNPLQHSCLGNPVDRGTWRATACGVTESDTTERLNNSQLLWISPSTSNKYWHINFENLFPCLFFYFNFSILLLDKSQSFSNYVMYSLSPLYLYFLKIKSPYWLCLFHNY